MKYEKLIKRIKKAYLNAQTDSIKAVLEEILPKLKEESKDEKIRKVLIAGFQYLNYGINQKWGKDEKIPINDILAWLEKQCEPNPYSGVSFEYNGHIWGMCARDNGVDISLDTQLFKHLEKQEIFYTKRDVDDAYIKGMAFAKDELEKQNKQIFANSTKICKDEQELTNNVIPKFRVGDTIRLKNSLAEYTIERISNGRYYAKGCSIDIIACNRDYELAVPKLSNFESIGEEYCGSPN